MQIIRFSISKILSQNTLKKDFIFAALIALSFVIISAVFVLGEYQRYAGDFGQYYIHSQNLIKGRSWSTFLEGYPAVLPGYPVLLSFITLIFGDKIFYVGLVNSIMWASTSLLAYNMLKHHFEHSLTAYTFLIICLWCPYIYQFQQEGVPNIFYAFSFFLAFLGATNLVNKKYVVLSILFVLLAAIIRIDSMTLYIAIFIYFAMSNAKKFLWVPVAGFAITIGLDFILSDVFNMKSNIDVGSGVLARGTKHDASAISSIFSFTSLFLHYVVGSFLRVSELLFADWMNLKYYFTVEAANGYKVKVSLIHLIISGFFIFSFLNIKKILCRGGEHEAFLSFDRLLFMGHICFVSIIFLESTHLRYLLPIFPIFVFHALIGFERLALCLKIPNTVAPLLVTTLALPITYHTHINIKDIPRRKNFLFSKDLTAAADQLAEIKNNRAIGMWKPRLLTALMEMRDSATGQSMGIRNLNQLESLMEQDGIFLAYKPRVREDMREYVQKNEHICATWTLNTLTLYEKKAEGRACIVTNER